MRVRVGCEFGYDSSWPTASVMLVKPQLDPAHRILEEAWEAAPKIQEREYLDGFNNRCERFVLPPGEAILRYDALVEVSGAPDDVNPAAAQNPVEALPDEVLPYTLASRYCFSDVLSNSAWELFGSTEGGWARVQAVCDWIHENIQYGVKSDPLTTAVDTYEACGGMCRDFAHLGITFSRALNIPARYVFGYMPDYGIPGPFPPMDFHAWFEVYLDDRWWTFDARFNTPRIGRIPIGRGRDAVDVAMMTTYGSTQFKRMIVWSDVVDADEQHPDSMPKDIHDVDSTEALLLDQ